MIYILKYRILKLHVSETNSVVHFLISILAIVPPLTINIYLWVSVLRFYREIADYDNNMAEFPSQKTNVRIIRKFMTEDEYALSKKQLKINARGYKENKLLTKTVIKIDKWAKENKVSQL